MSAAGLASRVICTLHDRGPHAAPTTLDVWDVRALGAQPGALHTLVGACYDARALKLTQFEPPHLAPSARELDGSWEVQVRAVCSKIEGAAEHALASALASAHRLVAALPPPLKGAKAGADILNELLVSGRPKVPRIDTSEVLGDTAQIEACKERLRPACCLVQCLPCTGGGKSAGTQACCCARLRCQCNAICLWTSLLCSVLCSLLKSLLLMMLCRRPGSPGSMRDHWLANIVELQQYKLHAKEAPKGAPSTGELATCTCEQPERDPFFCVGDNSVALQPPTSFPTLCYYFVSCQWGKCCCPKRCPKCTTSPRPLGGDIDHLSLVEGLLTAHCFRTCGLALLMVLALAYAVGVGFFFTAQALILHGFFPAALAVLAVADRTICPEGARAVLGAPQDLSCFRGAARVDPGAALGFAQAMAASGGVLAFNASQLAAATCEPVLGAMTSAVSRFYVPGLLQRVLRFSEPNTAEISPRELWLFTAWSLVPLAVLLLIGLLACDRRSPVPRKADSLRLLFTAEAREFMMCVSPSPSTLFSAIALSLPHLTSFHCLPQCALFWLSCRSYAWHFPSKEKQRARVIAALLPDCWLDVQVLTLGASVSTVIQQQAVWSRCMVVYGTRHYFSSENCLRELISALLYRRAVLDKENKPTLNIALLLDDCKCDFRCEVKDCKDCKADLTKHKCSKGCAGEPSSELKSSELIRLLKHEWGVKVFTDLSSFFVWVGERGDADVKPLLEWYRDVNGRPQALQLTDRLSNLVHTKTMVETGLCVRKGGCRAGCYDYFIVQHLSWCCPCFAPPSSKRNYYAITRCRRKACCRDTKFTVRFGQMLYEDELSLLEASGNVKEGLFVACIVAFIAALIADLCYSPPQSFAYSSGSDIAAFLFLSSSFDVFSLLLCVLVLLPYAVIAIFQARPSTYYSNFLEPLCIAAHSLSLEKKLQEQLHLPLQIQLQQDQLQELKHLSPSAASPQPSPCESTPLLVKSPSLLPAEDTRAEGKEGELPIYLVVSATGSDRPGTRLARVFDCLRTFLTDMGFYTEFVELQAAEAKLAKDKGLFVFFLASKDEGDKYLRLVPAAGGQAVDRTIPVLFEKVCEKSVGMYGRLFFAAHDEAVDEDEKCREIGAAILQALSKRVASALLGR